MKYENDLGILCKKIKKKYNIKNDDISANIKKLMAGTFVSKKKTATISKDGTPGFL